MLPSFQSPIYFSFSLYSFFITRICSNCRSLMYNGHNLSKCKLKRINVSIAFFALRHKYLYLPRFVFTFEVSRKVKLKRETENSKRIHSYNTKKGKKHSMRDSLFAPISRFYGAPRTKKIRG